MNRATRALAACIASIAVVIAAPVGAASASTTQRTTKPKTLTLSWGPRTASCSPPVDTGVAHCYPQAFGSVGIDDTNTLTYSGGDPLDQRADAQASDQATESLASAVSSVTYTWTFTVGNVNDQLGNDVSTSGSLSAGAVENYAALVLTAKHSTCTSCTASTTKVLFDEHALGDHTYFTRGSTITVSEMLVNAAGGSVPPGTVTLTGGVSSFTSWTATPTWAGTATQNVPITIQSVTASI